MLVKLLKCATVAAMCYYITLMIAFGMYNIIFDIPFDRNREISGMFIGLFVIILPYVLLGTFMNVVNKNNPLRASLFIGLFVIVFERLSIYLIGWNFVILRTDGWSYENILSPINFVWAEALPYYTPFYIGFGGFISLIISVVSTFWSLKLLKRKGLEPGTT